AAALWGVMMAWGAHLVRYLIAGGVTVLTDFSVYWLLHSLAGLWYLHAHFVSRTVGGVVCFLLNRHFTFSIRKTAGLGGDAARFLVLYAMSFLLASLLVYGFVSVLGAGAFIGKFLAECLVVLFNYTVMKYWVMARWRGDG
ncbi:MAG: GtrA family protein, partial [Deltaproteobacteria bacterium]|nr:GtrA family protein [Deltaproteobacteria bacterium]